MFTILFDMRFRPVQSQTFQDFTTSTRSDFQQLNGFVDIQYYRSLIRSGQFLAISEWKPEGMDVFLDPSFPRRTGMAVLMDDQRILIGENVVDTAFGQTERTHTDPNAKSDPDGRHAVTIVVASNPPGYSKSNAPSWCAKWLGLDVDADGLVEWDVLEGVDTENSVMFIAIWNNDDAAKLFESRLEVPEDGRLRRLLLEREYAAPLPDADA